jgi:hypothetical protein
MTVRSRTGVAGTRRFRATFRQDNAENASESRSNEAVVWFARTYSAVREYHAIALDNGMARSGPFGSVGSIVEITREFPCSATRALASARDCYGEHTTGTAHKVAHYRRSVAYGVPENACDARRTVLNHKQNRREASSGRLQCATLPCVAPGASLVPDDSVRRLGAGMQKN